MIDKLLTRARMIGYPWDSWKKAYSAEPPVWFHDIFRADGSAFDKAEVEFLRRVTGKARLASSPGRPAPPALYWEGVGCTSSSLQGVYR